MPRFRVDLDVSLFGAFLYVEADNEKDARADVEGMPVADLFAKISDNINIEPEIEDVEEVDEEGRPVKK